MNLLHRIQLSLLLVMLATPGCATSHSSREQALAALVRLRIHGGKATNTQEFVGLETAYARGEASLARGDSLAAEDNFLAVLALAELLLPPPGDGHVQMVQPDVTTATATTTLPAGELQAAAAVAAQNGDPNAGTVTATPGTGGVPLRVVPAVPVPAQDPIPSTTVQTRQPLQVLNQIIGGVTRYTVRRGDSLRLLAAKFGVSKRSLARHNRLDMKKPLQPGQVLLVDNRRILPMQIEDGLLINIPDRMLYQFRQGVLTSFLPVAVGKPKESDKQIWETPTGGFRVIGKAKDPIWRVPPSILKEYQAKGRAVEPRVLPGPKNPLGKYAIRTSMPGIMIHSTTAPASVYGFSSHGCIRLYPEQMEKFYHQVSINTRGEIIYQPVKLAVTAAGKIYLEVHGDVYDRLGSLEDETRQLIFRKRIQDRVDWDRVRLVVQEQSGVVEDVTF